MTTRYRQLILLCATAIVAMLSGCAKQGYPSGGPKDTQPPVALGCSPDNATLNFDEQEFFIEFDEYVVLKDAENNILVSPPMKHKPEYSSKGYGILVKIKDTLRENTTYLFQFKNAIADFTEGNALQSYEYVFSTGDKMDMHCIEGYVTEALTGKPMEKDVTVMAYACEKGMVDDSVVATGTPTYITRCDKSGLFRLNHIRGGQYKLAAIVDADHNLKFTPGEAIAWADNMITAIPMPDTLMKAKAEGDSSEATVAPRDTSHYAMLRISTLEQEVQRVLKSEMKSKGHAEITTQLPMMDPQIDAENIWWSLNTKGDTLKIWTKKSDCDSLHLVIRDSATMLCDTLTMKYKPPRHGITPATPPLIKSMVGAAHPFYDTLWLAFSNPVLQPPQNDSLVTVLQLSDSSTLYCGLDFVTPLKARIDFKAAPGKKYQFCIPKGSCRDMYGNSHDTLRFATEVTTAEQYGNFSITVSLGPTEECSDLIIQIMNEDGGVVASKQSSSDSKTTFSHLSPAKYRIRCIVDGDGDGKWTPGDYWKQRQPEKAHYYTKTIEVRANWDIEEHWRINP